MKKYLIILVSLLSFLNYSSVLAQQKKATYIYRNDNVFDAYACSEIESITYEDDGINVNQVIRAKDGTNIVPVSKIDSVSFEVPKTVFMQIPEDDLNGWESGFSLGDEYIVFYKDKSDNSLVAMTNKSGAEADKGLILCFDDDCNVVSVGTMSKLYDVKYEDNNIILYRINEDGLYEEEVIPALQASQSRKMAMRAPSAGDIWNFISKGADLIGNIQSGQAIGSDVLNWDWGQMVRDGLVTAGGFLVGKANPIAGFILTVGQWPIDHYRKQDEERKRAAMYADCEISIDEIRPENGSAIVYATVKNANNLPDYLVNMYDRTLNEKTRNLVSCGIVVRAHNEYVTTHVNDYKSQQTQLNGDVQYGSVANISFTIPGLDLTKNLSTYYFRPYLTSTRVRTNRGDVAEGHIKYGETVPYTAFNGEIKEFKQYDAQYSTDANNYGFVMFRTTVNATINNLDNLEEWGVYVYDLNGSGVYDYYPSEFRAAKLEDWIDIDFNINKSEFDELNNDYFLATKKVKMGVYQKLKNPTGNYDYMSYFYSEPQEYELVYDEKPSISFTNVQVGQPNAYPQYDDDGSYLFTWYTTPFKYVIKITGGYWIDNIQPMVYDNGSWSYSGGKARVPGGGLYSVTTSMNYDNTSNMNWSTGYDITLIDGSTMYSSNTLQIGGTPESPTISIGENASRAVKSRRNIKQTDGENNVPTIGELIMEGIK